MTSTDIYLRLSDLRTEDALDGREAKLRAEADRLGWPVHRVVIENDLSPNGQASAFKRKKIRLPNGRIELRTVRPGFRSVLGDIAAGYNLLCEDLDRMLRQPRDGEDLLDAVELGKASARSLSGSLTLTEGGTDSERMTARIMAAVANKSSADTARRVADGRERRCAPWCVIRRDQGKGHEGECAGILTRERWQQLVDLFASRANPGTSNEPRWLLSRYATCGVCGSPVKCTGTSKRRAYTCAAHGHVRRNATAVDSYVSQVIVARLSRPDAANLLKPPPRPGIDAARPRAALHRLLGLPTG